MRGKQSTAAATFQLGLRHSTLLYSTGTSKLAEDISVRQITCAAKTTDPAASPCVCLPALASHACDVILVWEGGQKNSTAHLLLLHGPRQYRFVRFTIALHRSTSGFIRPCPLALSWQSEGAYRQTADCNPSRVSPPVILCQHSCISLANYSLGSLAGSLYFRLSRSKSLSFISWASKHHAIYRTRLANNGY